MRQVRVYTVLKWLFIISFFTCMTIIFISSDVRNQNDVLYQEDRHIILPVHEPLKPPSKNWRNLTSEQIGNLSILGKYLFLDVPPPPKVDNKIFKILTWKAQFLERRHIYHFTDHKFDPFEKCSVKNCELSFKEEDLPKSDAVLFHLQRLKSVDDLPKEAGFRPENQRWVFLTDENPIFTFLSSKVKIEDFNNKFNWSMTYRMESDVPVPYGRTVLKNSNSTTKKEENLKKRNDILVVALGSNCGGKNHRWQYVQELQKYIPVDFYGKCGTLKCPGHFSKDCEMIGDYKFYLSFENSNCAQYITEKVWWNAYSKNSIPIVMGASKTDYEQLLPPNSYINIDDFARPSDLARYITYINKTYDIYQSYFEWKKYYRISNEHAYFQTDSYHYCRVCEALNYNSKTKKIYNNLTEFWNTNDCYGKWDDVQLE